MLLNLQVRKFSNSLGFDNNFNIRTIFSYIKHEILDFEDEQFGLDFFFAGFHIITSIRNIK